MQLALVVEIISAATLVFGVVFAAVQLRQFRIARERENALELVHSSQTTEFAKALVLLGTLSDGMSKTEIDEKLGSDITTLYVLLNTLETVGILVYRGEITLDLLDDFYSGPVAVSWRK